MDALGLALVALAYAVASEVIGLSRALPTGSVVGLVMAGLANLRTRLAVSSKEAAPAAAAGPEHHWGRCDYQELIELGYARRHALLERPGVEDVEVSVMGEQLVLTVYRSAKAGGGGEHAEQFDPLLPVDSYCASCEASGGCNG